VSLGGCTASFVSPQGLVATNHHCAYGAIQLNSTPENNLMRDGFYAAAIGDEISGGPSSRICALESIEDVTARVQAAVPAPRAAVTAVDPDGATRSRRHGPPAAGPTKATAPACTALPAATPPACCRTSRSATCACSTRRRAASAPTAAKPTTGYGRATPATS